MTISFQISQLNLPPAECLRGSRSILKEKIVRAPKAQKQSSTSKIDGQYIDVHCVHYKADYHPAGSIPLVSQLILFNRGVRIGKGGNALMFASMRSRVRAWITIGAGTVAAILAANLLGAFGALPAPAVPASAAGRAIATVPWRIIPSRAFGTDPPAYNAPAFDWQKILVLKVELTSRTGAST